MATTDTVPATVKDAAAAIRADLKATFPGVKFAVRKGTGTASAWIDVKWTDGPNDDMVRNVIDPYVYIESGSPIEGVSRDRTLSTGVLMQAQDLVRAVLPDFEVYDDAGRYVLDGMPPHAPIFHLGGWRFGGGDRYSALAMVADMLILNPRKGPVA